MSIFSSLTDESIKLIKQFSLFGIIALGLYSLGHIIDTYLTFSWLTSFFVLVRLVIGVFDFAFDIDTLFQLFSYVLAIQVGIWSFKAYIVVTKFFNEK